MNYIELHLNEANALKWKFFQLPTALAVGRKREKDSGFSQSIRLKPSIFLSHLSTRLVLVATYKS
ncbi:MAG: hypothetical protein DMF68_08810 [Acidobacteria bacterium]|nr:MAG: hypothetical protein DMF68_08810 [Acidobacteriota bacterium]